ncbi:hypothetical protein AAKU67_004396 [Oxalobacteraceae bacterium GrIS 2.11]
MNQAPGTRGVALPVGVKKIVNDGSTLKTVMDWFFVERCVWAHCEQSFLDSCQSIVKSFLQLTIRPQWRLCGKRPDAEKMGNVGFMLAPTEYCPPPGDQFSVGGNTMFIMSH